MAFTTGMQLATLSKSKQAIKDLGRFSIAEVSFGVAGSVCGLIACITMKIIN